MSDYYEYTSQITLAQPTVVTGYLSDYTRAATYRAAVLLGLPYCDIDRLVEHEAGMEIRRLLAEHGSAHHREVEARALESSLKQQPAALIALGDGGLLDEQSRARVRAGGRLIVLDFEPGNLLWRVQQLAQQPERGPWHPEYREIPRTLADIRPFHQERRAGFDLADVRIQADSLSAVGACEAIMASL